MTQHDKVVVAALAGACCGALGHWMVEMFLIYIQRNH